MRAHSALRAAPLALALLPACAGGVSLETELGDGLLFVLSLDERTQSLRDVAGPFDRTSLGRAAWAVEADERLALLTIDEDALAAIVRSYRREARREVSLIEVGTEVETCGPEGRLLDEERLELSLAVDEWAPGSVQLRQLHPAPSGDSAMPLPPGLRLRVPISPCGAGRSLGFRPYAQREHVFEGASHEGLDRLVGLEALGERALIVSFERGLVWLREDEGLDPERDLVEVRSFGLETPPDRKWAIRHVAVHAPDWPASPATVLVGLSASDGGALAGGAGWARLRLGPTGGWTVEDTWEVFTNETLRRAGFWFIHLEPSGRSIAVGREWMGIASRLDARPDFRRISAGFSGKRVVELEGPAPHLLLMDGGQVFEGDLFQEELSAGAYEFGGNLGLDVNGAARMGDDTRAVLMAGSDRQLWRRRARAAWSPLPYSLPSAAESCAAPASACGRRLSTHELGPIATAPGGEGVLFGSPRCTGVFWRRPREACAAFQPLPGQLAAVGDARGLRALLEHEGRIFAGAAEGLVYELELQTR